MSDECLFDSLVGVGLVLCQTLDLGWDVSERRVVGVSEVIIVEQSCVTLLDEFTVRAELLAWFLAVPRREERNIRVKTDVIKLVDTFPVVLNDSSSSVGITVQQVAGGVGN
jgi:hypothetical protein